MLNFFLLIEYAILGYLFWHVYLRKTPIYRVKGENWGSYKKPRDTYKLRSQQSSDTNVPIRIKQSRRNGWLVDDSEKRILHEIKNVDLESTAANPTLKV